MLLHNYRRPMEKNIVLKSNKIQIVATINSCNEYEIQIVAQINSCYEFLAMNIKFKSSHKT